MLCRVVHDGSHFVAHCPEKRPYRYVKRRMLQEHELAFRQLYKGTKDGTWELTDDGYVFVPAMEPKEQREFIISTLQDTFGDLTDWDTFVNEEYEREDRNYRARAKRFKRKAYFNDWNYFVTFTYDDDKCTEDSFKRRLRRALANLHTRHGWLYMGAFERAPETGRLHFHGLCFVPQDEMVGTIRKEESYSVKKHAMQTSYINDWFEKRFGRNDFEEIDMEYIRHGNTLGYVLKYIQKTGERIIYSRGIPSDLVVEICYDQIACEFFNFMKMWVLFENWQDIPYNASDQRLTGDKLEEWLICFTGYPVGKLGPDYMYAPFEIKAPVPYIPTAYLPLEADTVSPK